MIKLDCPMTMGMAIGTTATSDLLNRINSEMGSSHFFSNIKDVLYEARQHFIDNRIKPIREKARDFIKSKIVEFSVADKIVIIDDESKLEAIPTCMHEGILAFKPVKELFEQHRIFGFGFESAPEEDVYGRLINNGRIDDIAEAMDKNGMVEFEWTWKSTDPDHTFEDLDNMEATREWIEKFLEETNIDPTDYPNVRG